MRLFIETNRYCFYYKEYILNTITNEGSFVGWSMNGNEPKLIREQEERFIFI